MRDFARPLAVVALALAVPIVPFVLLGPWLEANMLQHVRSITDDRLLFWGVVLVLSTDVFLPVPSSGVATYAGAELGVFNGMAATWLGTTLGAAVGFAAAKRWGTRLALRLTGRSEFRRLRRASSNWGGGLLLLTRPLPILAEAAVLLAGSMNLQWRRFWLPVAGGNFVLANCYALLGDVASRHELLPVAIAVSLLLPVVVTWLVLQRLQAKARS